jgi:hypothetical protein
MPDVSFRTIAGPGFAGHTVPLEFGVMVERSVLVVERSVSEPNPFIGTADW